MVLTDNYAELYAANPLVDPTGFEYDVEVRAVYVMFGKGNGGAMWLSTTSTLLGGVPSSVTIVNSVFQQNAASCGGGVYIAGMVTCGISGTAFENNHAVYSAFGTDFNGVGGALMSDGLASYNIFACNLTGNDATQGGAGFHAASSTVLYLEATIDSNTAQGTLDSSGLAVPGSSAGGGVVVSESSVATVDSSTISNNGAANSGYGGAFNLQDSGTLIFNRSVAIVSNYAYAGAAIAADASVVSLASQIVANGVITAADNVATLTAGLLYSANISEINVGTLEAYVQSYGQVTSNNSAGDYGPLFGTAPLNFSVQIANATRTNIPLPVSVVLHDGLGQSITSWSNAAVQILSLNTTACTLNSGVTARSFFQLGAASFTTFAVSSLYPGSACPLQFTFTGDLLSLPAQNISVLVSPCRAEAEILDSATSTCVCAPGYGSVDGVCAPCGASSVVPAGQHACVACPSNSQPANTTDGSPPQT